VKIFAIVMNFECCLQFSSGGSGVLENTSIISYQALAMFKS